MSRVVEIILYQLKPGTGRKFHQIMTEISAPLHQNAGLEILKHDNSLHSEDTYFLIRTFANLEQMVMAQNDFYSSNEWQNGPRSDILSSIKSSMKSVLPSNNCTFTDRPDQW